MAGPEAAAAVAAAAVAAEAAPEPEPEPAAELEVSTTEESARGDRGGNAVGSWGRSVIRCLRATAIAAWLMFGDTGFMIHDERWDGGSGSESWDRAGDLDLVAAMAAATAEPAACPKDPADGCAVCRVAGVIVRPVWAVEADADAEGDDPERGGGGDDADPYADSDEVYVSIVDRDVPGCKDGKDAPPIRGDGRLPAVPVVTSDVERPDEGSSGVCPPNVSCGDPGGVRRGTKAGEGRDSESELRLDDDEEDEPELELELRLAIPDRCDVARDRPDSGVSILEVGGGMWGGSGEWWKGRGRPRRP